MIVSYACVLYTYNYIEYIYILFSAFIIYVFFYIGNKMN